MFFENKIFLLFLVIIPILAILGIVGFYLKSAKLNKLINNNFFNKLIPLDTKERQILKFILKLTALFFFIIALAGPKFGTKIVDVKRKGLDILIAIDTSTSMLAEDIKPNRITQAKAELKNIANAFEGNRIGVIAFAGESFLQCPLTLDINAIKMFLDFVDIGTVPQQGTDIGKVLKLAMNTFDKKERKYKVLILLTDGEDHNPQTLSQLQDARKEGIKIFTIGFGKKDGELIPLRNKNGQIIDYKRDENGNPVSSKLDEKLLQSIANLTDGKYYYSKNGFLDIEKITSDINSLDKKGLKSKLSQQYESRFYYFVFIGLCILFIEFLIKETNYKTQKFYS